MRMMSRLSFFIIHPQTIMSADRAMPLFCLQEIDRNRCNQKLRPRNRCRWSVAPIPGLMSSNFSNSCNSRRIMMIRKDSHHKTLSARPKPTKHR